MYEDLKIICWPDPRLRKKSKPVEEFNGELKALAERMLVLMREAKGVGLAGPQVGMNIRMIVMNTTGQAGDDRVYVNPVLSEAEGEEEEEEGCLSLPGINTQVVRSKAIRMTAVNLEGKAIDQKEAGYIARIWQHECDHLNGTMLTDRMGPTAQMGNRRILKDLEERYAAEHPQAAVKRKKR